VAWLVDWERDEEGFIFVNQGSESTEDGAGRSFQPYPVGDLSGKIRLDRWLTEKFPEFSRSVWQKKIRGGEVLIDGKQIDPREPLMAGRVVELRSTIFSKDPVTDRHPEPEEIPLDILWEDEDILVINKEPGMIVHPGAGCLGGTVVNAALFHCGSLPVLSEVDRPGVVHRLDKETSGVLVLAKNEASGSHLLGQFKERSLEKKYLAVVQGYPPVSEGSCDGSIGRHPVRRTRMAVIDTGRRAVSHWRLLGASAEENWGIMEIRIETGRTHQIRVHLSAEGYPILGDALYGYRKKRSSGLSQQVQRVLLHAEVLRFTHPSSGEPLLMKAPVPKDLQVFLDAIGEIS